MFERFTDRARRTLVLSQEEARLLGCDHIGTEHILLGLIHEGEGVASKALAECGIALEAVRDLLEVSTTSAATANRIMGSPPFTPRSKKVIELSLREALQLGHNYIGTEHLLLGIVREGEGKAAQALVTLGVDLSTVRKTVIRMLSGYTKVETASKADADRPSVEGYLVQLAFRAKEFARFRDEQLVAAAGLMRDLLAMLETEKHARTGVGMIADERARQITEEGYNKDHDRQHTPTTLYAAGCCYLEAQDETALLPRQWPFDAASWKPKDRVANLVRAGALVQAEMDRCGSTDADAALRFMVQGIAAEIDRLRAA